MNVTAIDLNQAPVLTPSKLKAGDKVRFVSPASTPDREQVMRRAKILEDWGLRVDFGEHAFDKISFLAGRDDDRLADFNAALNDPDIRAIFATRGGKGSYRIADRLDFAAIRRDPKFVVGFSDITALHLSLIGNCRLAGIHGTVMDARGEVHEGNEMLRDMLFSGGDVVLRSRPEENTAVLTTSETAGGRLVGGNLEMIATCAGWALPSLAGAILLLEAIEMQIGQVDRQLTMLRKAGHLDGVAGIAIGQFTRFSASSGGVTVVDLLRDHLGPLGVPILGGLPIGHGAWALPTPVGTMATLDTSAKTLTVQWPPRSA